MSRTTLHSLIFALVVGLVAGASPFTPHGILASLVSGALVGAAVLGFRMVRANGAAVESADDEERVVLPPLLFWVVLLAFLTAFASTGLWLYRQWTSSIWNNGHGLFTPLIMGYLGYMALRRERSTAPESSPWGFAFLGAGLFLLVYDSAIRTQYLAAIGLVVCVPGLSLLTLGARRTRLLALPLLIGLFMIPIPDDTATHLLLRQITSVGVLPLLNFSGMPYVRDETVFLMPGVNFHVSDACSGFATLYAAVAISIILSVYTRPTWRRLLVLIATFPLAILANVVRIFGLMVLCRIVGPHIMHTQFHPMTGAATFVLIAGALFLIAGRRTLREALS